MIITFEELEFINQLAQREYTSQALTSNATNEEEARLRKIKRKLDSISTHFKVKYDNEYGAFKIAKNRNPLDRQSRLRNVWSGIYKGASKKHFAAQISFVIVPNENCLHVGFYFGIGNAPDLSIEERTAFQNRLLYLGGVLRGQLINNNQLKDKFQQALEVGFKTLHHESHVSSNEWVNFLATQTATCRLVYPLFPEGGEISFDRITSCVNMIISFMDAIPSENDNTILASRKIKPLSAADRAKQAKRLKEIGDSGEAFALKWETERLMSLGENFAPIHRAQMSDSYHYDIESRDGINPLYIEVKTTVLKRDDTLSRRFYISVNEYDHYCENPSNYRLYRVFDIEGTPSLEIVDMTNVQISPNVYIANF